MDAHPREAPEVFNAPHKAKSRLSAPLKLDHLSGTAIVTHRIRFQLFFSAAFHKFTRPGYRKRTLRASGIPCKVSLEESEMPALDMKVYLTPVYLFRYCIRTTNSSCVNGSSSPLFISQENPVRITLKNCFSYGSKG